jgi:hypothetical protein
MLRPSVAEIQVRIVAGRVGVESRENQEAPVAGVVGDVPVVRGDRSDFGKPTRVLGGEFVEGAVGIEEVALRADLAADPFAIGAHHCIERGSRRAEAARSRVSSR